MTCSDVEQALPELLDGEKNGAFPTEVENHLQSCVACSGLFSDLESIADAARELVASEEPPPRVWARIALELRSEGLIRDQPADAKLAPGRPILLPTAARRRWSSTAWWLAPVAAALVAGGSYVVSHKPATPVAQNQAPVNAAPSSAPSPAGSAPTTPLVAQAPVAAAVSGPTPQHPAQKSAQASMQPTVTAQTTVEPEPSADDQQFLSAVSTRAPSMRATYENQLKAVNADILETQAYVDRNPRDAEAREHLMEAYQQKALLYQIALDRIQ